ncbi:lipoyl(octanoyl) transferase LipB [Rhodohalobacter sp. 8-1]|uniref:lipoyl(octanoyl) transferase LipB n=1 Tax=Rhodohalobacter sp. 8-1 TaxID=3131972 RepID=UPI0030EB68CF
MGNRVELFDLGTMPYRKAWDLQRKTQKQLIDQKLAARNDPNHKKKIPDSLIFVEHPHVYTLGKSGDAAHLLKGLVELKKIDADFIENDRGGDITYHGPGQIVGYPILDLDRYFTDVHKYLRYLEEVIIRTCADYGISAGRIDGLTGVWVEDEKICAMGIRCSRWVTMHGFALNVNADLSYFDHIVPCGIRDKQVTSLSKILGKFIDIDEVKRRVAHHFSEQFGAEISEIFDGDQLLKKIRKTSRA